MNAARRVFFIMVLATLYTANAYTQQSTSHNPLLIDKAFPLDTVRPTGRIGYTLRTDISKFDNSRWFQGQRGLYDKNIMVIKSDSTKEKQ